MNKHDCAAFFHQAELVFYEGISVVFKDVSGKNFTDTVHLHQFTFGCGENRRNRSEPRKKPGMVFRPYSRNSEKGRECLSLPSESIAAGSPDKMKKFGRLFPPVRIIVIINKNLETHPLLFLSPTNCFAIAGNPIFN